MTSQNGLDPSTSWLLTLVTSFALKCAKWILEMLRCVCCFFLFNLPIDFGHCRLWNFQHGHFMCQCVQSCPFKAKSDKKKEGRKNEKLYKKFVPPYYVLKFNGKSVFYAKVCGATFTINAASPRLIHSTIAPVMCGTTCTVLPKYFPSRSWCFCRDNCSLETTVGTLQPAAVLLDDWLVDFASCQVVVPAV